MKRLIALTMVVLFTLSLTCVVSAETDYPKMSLGLASIFVDPASNPAFNAEGLAQQHFADLVKERSGGQITIKNYWGGMLQGDYPTMLSDGELELYYGFLNAAVDPRVSALNLPGLVTNLDMAWDLMGTNGEFYKVYKDIASEYGITCLAGTAGIMRGFYNSKRPVKVPSDASDMMIRAYSDATVTTYWGGLGNTVILPMSELYTSMQMGAVDGFEHGSYSVITNNLHEVAKYYSVINWQWQYMPSFFASSEVYEGWDSKVVALIEECADEAAKMHYELAKDMQEKALEFLSENGVEVYVPTAEEQKLWDDYGYSLYDQLAKALGAEELVKELVEISNAYKQSHAN